MKKLKVIETEKFCYITWKGIGSWMSSSAEIQEQCPSPNLARQAYKQPHSSGQGEMGMGLAAEAGGGGLHMSAAAAGSCTWDAPMSISCT